MKVRIQSCLRFWKGKRGRICIDCVQTSPDLSDGGEGRPHLCGLQTLHADAMRFRPTMSIQTTSKPTLDDFQGSFEIREMGRVPVDVYDCWEADFRAISLIEHLPSADLCSKK